MEEAGGAIPPALVGHAAADMSYVIKDTYPDEVTTADINMDERKKLGSGSYGEVYLVRPRNTNLPAEPVVLKISTQPE